MADLKYLINAMNVIMPDNPISENDFRSLTSNFIIDFFSIVLTYVHTHISFGKRNRPETITNKCCLHKHINFLLSCYNETHSKNYEIKVTDLRVPSKKIEGVMKICMNFIILLHDKIPKDNKRIEEVKKKKHDIERLKLLFDAQSIKLNSIYIEKHDLEVKVKKNEEKKVKILKDMEHFKQIEDSDSKKNCLQKQMEVLLNLKNDSESLQKALEETTDKYKKVTNIDDLKTELNTLKQGLTEKLYECNTLEELNKEKFNIISSFTTHIIYLEELKEKISKDISNKMLQNTLTMLNINESDLQNKLKLLSKHKDNIEIDIAKNRNKSCSKEYLQKFKEIDGDLKDILKDQVKVREMVTRKHQTVEKVALICKKLEKIKEELRDCNEQIKVKNCNMFTQLKKFMDEVNNILNSAGK